MKYLITALIFLSITHANTEGECRKLFKSSKSLIEGSNTAVNQINNLYYKQEEFIISKDKASATKVTKKILSDLMKAKDGFKRAAPLSMKAISRCSGRAKKAKNLLARAKSGIEEVNFKIKINKTILADL